MGPLITFKNDCNCKFKNICSTMLQVDVDKRIDINQLYTLLFNNVTFYTYKKILEQISDL